MAREYGRIRAVPNPPVEAPLEAPDYRWYAALAGGSIVLGLVILATLVYGVYFVRYSVIPSVTDPRTATLTAIVGTAEVREAGSTRWSVASTGLELREGDTVRTRENSRAFVTLFDQSTATLYPLTEMRIDAMRANRFGTAVGSPQRTIVRLHEFSGRALLGVAHLNPVSNLQFEVDGSDAQASLTEGSYIVKVTPAQTFEVVATRGSSTVQASGGQVTVHGGERTQVRSGQRPDPPILAAEDLIENGTFTQSDGPDKLLKWDFLAPTPEGGDVRGQTRITTDASFPVVRFTRTGGTYHAEQGIRQTVGQDVTDYNVVRLDLRFKVFSQTVPGGGDQGSEYPLMVRVNYLDETGTPALFVRGFYVQNNGKLPTTNGQSVKAGEWINMVDADGIQLQRLNPRPQFIQSVEIVASGHDYDSEIQRVALVVE
ncbi:MAG TPA: hypothetical protein VK009_00875 [Chloroflexota bacterium]|nr:hypothetical protein [Chloroflexota bacterium]